jgi:hypothetical protein
MTTETQIETKKNPDFYVFVKGADGKNYRAGAVFNHTKGDGFNIVIGEVTYAAFPPKAKTE